MDAFDLHHFHSAEPLFMAASMFTGRRRVYTHRGAFHRYPGKRRARYEIAGLFLRRAVHGVSANTAHAADAASHLFRIPRGRFHITYNGLDFDLLAPREPADRVRADLEFSPEHFVVGTTAHLRSWKRIDRMLEAIATVDRPNVRAVIVGDGPDRERLEQLAAGLGVSGQTVFTGWEEHVADIVRALDAFCMPSSPGESFGNSAVEAMALGVPTTIFSDGGGLLEHVTDADTGFVVDGSAELAAVLRALIDDRELAKAVGKRGQAFVRDRYTLDRAAERYVALYRDSVRAAGPCR
jgi:glycosyltransferase involved in cell wall biosynthesis